MSGLYQRTSQSLEGLTDVDITNIQDGQAPVYDATEQVYKNQNVLTPSSLPSGSSGDVIISNGTGGIDSTSRLNVNPSNGNITGSYVNVSSTTIKLGEGALTATDAVGIGWNAGFGANNKSVSIGTIAGGSAGESSVSLGYNAKADDDNSIVINATGAVLESGASSSFNIAPVRDINATTLINPYVVQYDDLTKEMFKSEDLLTRDIKCRDINNTGTLTNEGTASLWNGQLTVGDGKVVAGAGNNNLVVDLTNQRVGINNANPQYALDVVGHIRLKNTGADRLIFNNTTIAEDIADLDTIVDGGNGGIWGVRTKVDGGVLTEKLRINNKGAIGIGGAIYGTTGQVLTSNDATGAVSWVDIYNLMYPVGSVFIWYNDTNWSGFANASYMVWQEFAMGRVLVGRDTTDVDFNSVGNTGGVKDVQLTIDEMPRHTHFQNPHTHIQDEHNHTQDAHNHTQDAHNHTQDAHNHTQDAHSHIQTKPTARGGSTGVPTGVDELGINIVNAPNSTATAVATNQATIATNQTAIATNQTAIATNQTATATNQTATATNQTAGDDNPHTNLQPYHVVRYYRRTA